MGCNRTEDMISNLVVYGQCRILMYNYMTKDEDLDKITLLAVYLQFMHQKLLNKHPFVHSFDR